MKKKIFSTLLLVLLTILLTPACGHKGPPVPPADERRPNDKVYGSSSTSLPPQARLKTSQKIKFPVSI
ncbi:hypothetical protein UR09_03130 [Candidatus Nitromaritima sp. SCGC AAA799-A02]|nr:hypothetical protein UZ36_06615 [Candidatus Nitromaritima sp. SCGC AAA799-C22]KMP11543.1 hypothetical protein UR09_03130 [Candidatus Nitromaritima sp. SCGC AAA799-A02]